MHARGPAVDGTPQLRTNAPLLRRHLEDTRRQREAASTVKALLDDQVCGPLRVAGFAHHLRTHCLGSVWASRAPAGPIPHPSLNPTPPPPARNPPKVQHVNDRRAAEAEAEAQAVARMTAHWARLGADAAAADAAERARLAAMAEEVEAFNRLRLQHMSAAERRERELDLRILQDALEREAEEEAADQAAKEAKREEVCTRQDLAGGCRSRK
jgi:hypothetical protein